MTNTTKSTKNAIVKAEKLAMMVDTIKTQLAQAKLSYEVTDKGLFVVKYSNRCPLQGVIPADVPTIANRLQSKAADPKVRMSNIHALNMVATMCGLDLQNGRQGDSKSWRVNKNDLDKLPSDLPKLAQKIGLRGNAKKGAITFSLDLVESLTYHEYLCALSAMVTAHKVNSKNNLFDPKGDQTSSLLLELNKKVKVK